VKKIIVLFLCLCLALSGIAGCAAKTVAPAESVEPAQQDTSEETAASAQETEPASKYAGRYLGISWPSLEVPFFSVFADKLKLQAEETGMKCEIVSCDFDPAKQIEQLENLASMGCTDIIICPSNEEALKDTLKAIRAKGINVHSFAYDFGGDTECYDSVTVADQYLIGTTIAQVATDWVAQKWPDAADGSIKVATIEYRADPDNIKRSDGIDAGLTADPKIDLVNKFEVATMDSVDAQNAVDMILMQNPDVKVIVCHFASMALAGDERALQHSEIDRDNFAIIAGDFEEEIGNRLLASLNNESLIRGAGTYDPSAWTLVFEVCMGEHNDELVDKHYVFHVFPITPENCEQYMTIYK